MHGWKDRGRRLAAGAAAPAAALALLVWGAGPASAGGPTSVLLVSPESGETAALYNADKEYRALERLLGPLGTGTRDKPPEADLTSSRLINVTWMVHDVDPWRVDRVHLMAKDTAVWIHTAGKLSDPANGTWHRTEHASDLRALLKRLSLLGGTSPTGSRSGVYPAPWETAPPPTGERTAATPTARTAAATTNWWWALPGAATGAALTLLLHPYATRHPLLRRPRDRGPRQELLDM